MRSDIPRYVFEDLRTIRQTLGSHLARAAIFGSCLTKYYKDASDVDVALFVRPAEFDEVKQALMTIRLSQPVRITSCNGTYDAASSKADCAGKDYHVVLLHERNPNITFMQINEGKLAFLEDGDFLAP
jgi:predicted nucleotidyltransferase